MLLNLGEQLTFLTAKGEVTSSIEARTWHGHPLGAPQDWSQSLKTALQIILASPSPTFICWGPEQFLFYNDSFASLLGAAHPKALGQPAEQILKGLWPDLAPAMAQVVNRGEASRLTTAIPCASGCQSTQGALALSPLADDQGRPRAVLCAIVDMEPEYFNAEGSGDLQALQHKLLELTLQERPLELVLDELMRAVRTFVGRASPCSILLTDKEGVRLYHGAAIGLAKTYTDAIDGLEIGPAVGSCGTAAYRKSPVAVADIANESLWADFRDLALAHDLRACWSHPSSGPGISYWGHLRFIDISPDCLPRAKTIFLIWWLGSLH